LYEGTSWFILSIDQLAMNKPLKNEYTQRAVVRLVNIYLTFLQTMNERSPDRIPKGMLLGVTVSSKKKRK